jgi:DNA-binding GntR family transcriptional regulator
MAEEAYYHIRERIVSQEFAPGTVLDKSKLLSDLEIGRTPLREALQRLALERLIVIAPQKGTFVSDFSIVQLKQAFDARLLVEKQAARVAALRIADRDLRLLKELTAASAQLNGSTDRSESISLDQRFHKTIAEASQNDYLVQFLDMLLPVTMRLWHYAATHSTDSSAVIQRLSDGHQSIVGALALGDPNAAESAVSQHILRFQNESLALIMGSSQQPKY